MRGTRIPDFKKCVERVLKEVPRKPVKATAFLAALLPSAPLHIPNWIAYHDFTQHIDSFPVQYRNSMRASVNSVQRRVPSRDKTEGDPRVS